MVAIPFHRSELLVVMVPSRVPCNTLGRSTDWILRQIVDDRVKLLDRLELAGMVEEGVGAQALAVGVIPSFVTADFRECSILHLFGDDGRLNHPVVLDPFNLGLVITESEPAAKIMLVETRLPERFFNMHHDRCFQAGETLVLTGLILRIVVRMNFLADPHERHNCVFPYLRKRPSYNVDSRLELFGRLGKGNASLFTKPVHVVSCDAPGFLEGFIQALALQHFLYDTHCELPSHVCGALSPGNGVSLGAGRSETTFTPLCVRQVFGFLDIYAQDRADNHLCDSHAFCHAERGLAVVDQQHAHFTAVSFVDCSRRIKDGDAVFSGNAATRSDLRLGVGRQLNRDPGVDEAGITRCYFRVFV